MVKLIYCHSIQGYQTFDSEFDSEVIDQEESLKMGGYDVLFIVDYRRRFIFQKGSNYSIYRDFINDIIFDPKYATNY